MNVLKALKLMKRYSVCPNCGNQFIGGKEGSLEIEDKTFTRKCKCGWNVEINLDKDDMEL